MYFIQFEQPPSVISEETPVLRTWIRSTITIATIPNNIVYNQGITLRASLVSSNDNDTPCLTELYEWRAGTSSLSIKFDVTIISMIWPARVLVSAKRQEDGCLAPLESQMPMVCLAWSCPFDDSGQSTSHERGVERRFTLSSQRVLRAWEDAGRWSTQIKSSGVALLSYLDNVIGLRTDGIDRMEQKFALATSKKLNIVDMSQNCGTIGIAVAQLIPDSNVIVLDDNEAMPIIKQNIQSMSPAILSTVVFKDWNSEEAYESKGRPVDMIFTTASQQDDGASSRAVKILKSMLERSARVVVVVVEEEDKEDYSVGAASAVSHLMGEYGRSLCGSDRLPGGSVLPQYHVRCYGGTLRR